MDESAAAVKEAKEDATKLAPQSHKVVLENDRVRVMEIRIKPGEKIPMHSHPANILYSLSAATMKLTRPDGTSTIVEMKAGDCTWREAMSHEVENVGETEFRAVGIEIKK